MIWRCGKRILNKVDLPRSVVGEGCRVYLTGGGPKVCVGGLKKPVREVRLERFETDCGG